jgi:hypothetical protein
MDQLHRNMLKRVLARDFGRLFLPPSRFKVREYRLLANPHAVFAEKGQPSPHRVADRGHFGGRQVFVTIVVCL